MIIEKLKTLKTLLELLEESLLEDFKDLSTAGIRIAVITQYVCAAASIILSIVLLAELLEGKDILWNISFISLFTFFADRFLKRNRVLNAHLAELSRIHYENNI